MKHLDRNKLTEEERLWGIAQARMALDPPRLLRTHAARPGSANLNFPLCGQWNGVTDLDRPSHEDVVGRNAVVTCRACAERACEIPQYAIYLRQQRGVWFKGDLDVKLS